MTDKELILNTVHDAIVNYDLETIDRIYARLDGTPIGFKIMDIFKEALENATLAEIGMAASFAENHAERGKSG